MQGKDGELQGIIPSLWRLWSQKTGVPVRFHAYDWPEALRRFGAGEGDVMDSLFALPERRSQYDFGVPYADVSISLFVSGDAPGVHDAASTQGYVVGVSDNDACRGRLAASGADNFRIYPDFESLAQGAVRGEIKVFCMDRPSGNYYLAKYAGEDRYWFSPQLYSMQLAWATRPDATELHRMIARGFDAISPAERRVIEDKWQNGAPFHHAPRLDWRPILVAVAVALGGTGLLALWVKSLRVRVAAATRELRATTEDLARQKMDFRRLADNSPDSVARFDLDARYLHVSPWACRYYGRTEKEVLGRRPDEVAAEGDQPGCQRLIGAIRLCGVTGQPGRIEIVGYDGGIGEIRLIPEFDDRGTVTSVLTLARDITKQKTDRQALERLNRALRTIGAANALLLRCTDKMRLFEEMCHIIVAVGGYRMAWIGLIDEHDSTVCPVAHAGHEAGYLTAVPFLWKEGRLDALLGNDRAGLAAAERGYDATITLPLRQEESVFGCLTIHAAAAPPLADELSLFEDLANNLALGFITLREKRRRAEMERQIEGARKLEMLGQLARGIAHDFNNLLGAILGFGTFIAEDVPPDRPSHHHAQRILTAGRRGKTLIGQILAFSRGGGSRREVFRLDDVAAETRSLLAATLPATTQFELRMDGDLGVEGDKDRMHQLLMNLCINAHESYEGRPGRVTVAVRRAGFPAEMADPQGCHPPEVGFDERGWLQMVVGSAAPGRDLVSLSVTDRGCGMDRAKIGKVFTPFFSTKSRGTGLGLSIVLNVATAHGGAVVVRSRKGAGTEVEVLLPLARPPAAAGRETDPAVRAAIPARRWRVLLIDDDLDHSEMLLAALERRGCEVAPSADPIEALAELSQTPDQWDLLIADQTMPHMTGLDCIAQARAIHPDLTCILCSGAGETMAKGPSPAAYGVSALLRKPFDLDELDEVLQRLAIGENGASSQTDNTLARL